SGDIQLHWWDGSAWHFIDSVPQGTTTYSWTIPSAATNGAALFVGNAVDGAWEIGDASDQAFATLIAGDLIFTDGFQSGDLSAWSSAAVDGGDLRVSASAGL